MPQNNMKNSSQKFKGKAIRFAFCQTRGEMVFAAMDVCNALIETKDARKYWGVVKLRLEAAESQLTTNCSQLKMRAADDKMYRTDVLNKEGAIGLASHLKYPNIIEFTEWLDECSVEDKKFVLKHKNIDVLEIELDDLGEIIDIGSTLNSEHMPIATVDKNGSAVFTAIRDWWKNRSIPASRDGLRSFLEKVGLSFPLQLVKKCSGLSLSDQYWICPIDQNAEWEDVNFFDNEFSEDVGKLMLFEMDCDDVDAISLNSPDNTSDGVLRKKWKIINGKRCLVKGGTMPLNQEVANEALASMICERLGIPYTNYEILELDGDVYSVCEGFINRDTELVPVSRINELIKKSNHTSKYEALVIRLEELNIKDARRFIDMMITLDYIIANTDRHYNNFGLIRDATTLKWISMAPVFDSGTSMWCKLNIFKNVKIKYGARIIV